MTSDSGILQAGQTDTTTADEFSSQAPLTVWEVLDEEYWALRGMAPEEGRRGEEETDRALKEAHPRIAHDKTYSDLWREYANAKRTRSIGDGGRHFAEAEEAFSGCLCKRLADEKRSALCFSGGGIRSATFGLGVLQGLAQRSCDAEHPDAPPKLLSQFQYLSTVSGGGYLGGWFSAWAKREGLNQVIKKLAAHPVSKLDPEPQPVKHLRTFSNYLNPKLGALSADTWTLVATVIRNMFLNWLVLLPLIAAVLLVPKLVMDLAQIKNVPYWFLEVVTAISFLLGALAFCFTIRNLPGRTEGSRDHAENRHADQRSFLVRCMLPLSVCVLGLALTWWWMGTPEKAASISARGFMALVAALLGTGALLGLIPLPQRRRASAVQQDFPKPMREVESKGGTLWVVLGIMAAAVLVPITTGWLMHSLFNALHKMGLEAFTVFAGSGILGIVIVTQALLVGLVSWFTGDEDREWWARAGAWVYIVMLAWTAAAGLVLFSSPLFRESIHGLRWLAAAVLSSASLGGIASALGLSSKTPATDVAIPFSALSKSQIAAKLAVPVALTGFLVLLVLSVAGINEELLKFMKNDSTFHDVLMAVLSLAGINEDLLKFMNAESAFRDVLLMLIFGLPALALSFFINANKFSLHGMYRARLIRAFLGASHTDRDPNQFTGFDSNDNCSLHDLASPPLHILNMALNLVKGENLAWQERKAGPFTASALHTGSMRVGYQRSENYAKSKTKGSTNQGMTLGGAMAISGAAASPNMGYHSSPLMTMVMMLFNARLGAWLANPGQDGRRYWSKPGPLSALVPFIHEGFGMTTDHDPWVYLSDGGHFENLGLYEMVLRRCHSILVVDASADPNYQYEDLANAIRKIRLDLGVPIKFKSPLFSADEKSGQRHFATAEILYSELGEQVEDGVLIYIKPSITGNEPTDVVNYHKRHLDFPHQTTGDQWFDESQFESYRCLGAHVIDEILGEKEEVYELEEFFQKAKSGAKPGLLETAFTALAG